MLARQVFNLFQDAVGIFGAELHAGAVQTAECAMMLFAPPASSRRFDGQHRLASFVPVFVAALLPRIEVLVELRDWRLIHIVEIGRASRILDRLSVAPHDSRHAGHRLPAVQTADHFGKRNLTIAAVHVVYLRTAVHDLVRDVVLQARAAEYDGNVRIPFFQCLREGQAGQALLENNRESDQPETPPIHSPHAKLDEFGRLLVANLAEPLGGAAGAAADGAKNPIVSLEVFVIASFHLFAECRFGPDPFAHQAGPYVGNGFVNVPSDTCSKIHEERKILRRNSCPLKGWFQQGQLEGRKPSGKRRHADQGDWLHDRF
jgi:hypothetical protein